MTENVISDVTIQCSLNSRVAIVGANGAGKSTMVKALIGELEAKEGVVWKHPNLRVAYVAQHAFHHLDKVQGLALSKIPTVFWAAMGLKRQPWLWTNEQPKSLMHAGVIVVMRKGH